VHRKRTGPSALAIALVACMASQALGQECPSTSTTGSTTASQMRILEGRLVFHDGIRQWSELQLDAPECGQSSVQLIQLEKKAPPLEILRGCRVRSSGAIDFSSTGYYSLDTFQDVKDIEPVGACSRQPPFPDYSGAMPDKEIESYQVQMHIDYRPGDHPVVFDVRSAGRELQPWQAYASYLLTGGFVLYGRCGDGFVIDRVSGTPEANPGHFADPRTSDDMASFDPETAAQSGRVDLHLGYTCIRAPARLRPPRIRPN
jgi:hypothetical protein